VGPRPGLEGAKNLVPTGIRSTDRPAHSESLYRLSYRGPQKAGSLFMKLPRCERNLNNSTDLCEICYKYYGTGVNPKAVSILTHSNNMMEARNWGEGTKIGSHILGF
jgi:hypothetical protein